MRYLGLALYAEGPRDYHFLEPLLHRVCAQICVAESPHVVEVSDVRGLDHPSDLRDAPRHTRVVAAAKEGFGAWQLLFVHADGAGDPNGARENLVAPAIRALQAEFGETGIGVAVIPVRESEAWALADGNALRSVLGTTLSDDELGLPVGAAGIESDADPKATLDRAFKATNPTRLRGRLGTSPYLKALGGQIDLARLEALPAFALLQRDIRGALGRLNIL